MKAVGEYVLLKRVKNDKTPGGIILPDNLHNNSELGVVESIGFQIEAEYKVGDTVVFRDKYRVHEIGGKNKDNDGIVAVHKDDIVAVV